MFSHGWLRMFRNTQLIVFPDASGKRKAPRKCHNHTLAYVSTIASGASGARSLKFCVIHMEFTPEVFLQNSGYETDGMEQRH
jgi:hypothetical protein